MSKDKRVDEYISKSADFAKPILKHLRSLVHQACPDVEETIKWSFPHFDYNGIMCSMASFKNHCAFTFWKASLISDTNGIFVGESEGGMGDLGKISSMKDLPDDEILIRYIQEAVRLNVVNIKVKKIKKTVDPKALVIPEEFAILLDKNKKARKSFTDFSPSHQKEYISWITEAKTEATKIKRMNSAIEMLSEGKSRNWKYEKK